MDSLAVDFGLLASQLGKLLLAYVLCFPMGWDREQTESSSLGLRTFPLVAVGCCAFALVGQSGLGGEPDTMSRVLQGIIAGIGFLGGGAIVKQGMTVRGVTTAAAVWNTAALGVAVAAGDYGVAVALAVIGFVTLRWLRPLKDVVVPKDDHGKDGGAKDDREDDDERSH